MSKNVPMDKGFLKLILSQYCPAFRRTSENKWRKAFAFFPTPISGKENAVKETAHFCFYEYRYYDEVDHDDPTTWKMYEARLPGAPTSYTKCIVGISV